MAEDNKWEVGDLVILKGHCIPVMVIEDLTQRTEGNVAKCMWFNRNGEVVREEFKIRCLKEKTER